MDSRLYQFPVVWLVLRLPSLRPYAWPLFGFLAVQPFLPSGSRRCVLSLTLGFSVPLPVSSSWAPLSRYSSLQLPPLRGTLFGFWILPLCPLVCILLLFTRGLPLVSVSWDVFLPGPPYVPGFSLLFSGLRISRSPPCFGLERFLGFLSFRLLGFPVLSSPCGVSRLTTLSLFLSVPRFLLDWMVTSSVLFGGFPPSPPVHRPSLGWPTRSISLLRLSLLVCSWGRCYLSFPPSRLWSPLG